MRSIDVQGYPNLELGDAGVEQARLPHEGQAGFGDWTHARATSLYEAVNRFFARSTGEVLGWLYAGELLHRGALFAAGGVFADLPQVDWITGIPTVFGENGEAVHVKHLERWSRTRFLAGANKYIHRDTTFWRRRLWEKAGAGISPQAGEAAEFELFLRFFRYARLHSTEALLGGWRMHPGDFAGGKFREYNRACDEMAGAELRQTPGLYAAKAFRVATRFVNRIPVARRYWHKFVLQSLYRCPGWDWPPKIVHRGGRWQLT